MSDNEFHANQQRQSIGRRQQNSFRIPDRQRPDGIGYQEYKNRHAVSAKLTPVNWTAFRAWCVKNKLGHNSGINRLIATHPEIQTHG